MSVLVYDTSGRFDLSPQLDNLEGKRTKLTLITVLYQSYNEEEKEIMGYFIPNLLSLLLHMTFQMVLNTILGFFNFDHILGQCGVCSLCKNLYHH